MPQTKNKPDAPYGPKVAGPEGARQVLEYEENIPEKQKTV